MIRFQVYRNDKGEYRWRVFADNNRIIATSGEGYRNRKDCVHGIQLLKNEAAIAQIEDASQ
jgi:uncharacterized protein YegP (UPF0339 family)